MIRTSFFFVLILASLLAQPPQKNIKKDYPPKIYYNGILKQSSIADLVNQVSYDSLYNILDFLEQKGVRSSGTNNQTLNEVRDWIISKLSDFGYSVSVQDVYHYSNYHGQNIIIEKTGITYPDEKIIVGAHYDSVPTGPGVNDNGSGVAALLEIARIINTVQTDYSVIMVWFTGEEHGYYGSTEYAQQVFDEGVNIKIMFNMDQIGGISNYYDDPYLMTAITCERDERNTIPENNAASWAYTDTLAMLTNTYTEIDAVIDYAYGTDYIPFENLGYVITGYYEYLDVFNPYYHQSTDVLSNMDVYYLQEVTKGGVAFTAHVAKTASTTGIYTENIVSEFYLLKAYPNPFNPTTTISYSIADDQKVTLTIYNTMGQKVRTLVNENRVAGRHIIEWNGRNDSNIQASSGIYFYRLNAGSFLQTRKMILLK